MPNTMTATPASSTETTGEKFDPVAYARSLVGRIRELRRETEVQAKIPDELVEAMEAGGLFSMVTPREYGGLQTSITTWMEANTEIARGDAGVAWAMTLINGCNWMAAACYPKHVSDEVFAKPNTRVSGVFSPRGCKAHRVKGGIQIDKGTWYFNSGVNHAHWDLLGVPMLNENNEVVGHGIALLPMSDVKNLDDWDTIGLRGSGSTNVSVENVFVPDERIVDLMACAQGKWSGGFGDIPVFNSAFMPLMVILLCFPALGAAMHMLEEMQDQLPKRAIQYTTYAKQGEAAVTHLQLGEASARIDAAKLMVAKACADIDEWGVKTVEQGEYMPLSVRGRIGRDTGAADLFLVEGCEILAAAGGGSFARVGNTLNRNWQDVRVASMHPFAAPKTNFEIYGRMLCGLDGFLRPL